MFSASDAEHSTYVNRNDAIISYVIAVVIKPRNGSGVFVSS